MNTQTASAPQQPTSRSRWTAFNILFMVIGFLVFWPLGLATLVWIVWGDEIVRMASDLKDKFRAISERSPFRGMTVKSAFRTAFSETGNVAFDEYRARELKRLEEERRKLEGMRMEFEGFLKELRRVKDQEEFDRFMAEYRTRTGGPDETA